MDSSARISPKVLRRLLLAHGAALELFAAQYVAWPEDCVQEAFIELARLPEAPDEPAAWLYRVVRNRAVSRARSELRRERREKEVGRRAWFEQSHHPGMNQAAVDAESLTAALRALSEEQREVIVARIWGGLTLAEIAGVVGVSVSTVHRRYEAGLAELREALGLSWLTEKKPTTNRPNH